MYRVFYENKNDGKQYGIQGDTIRISDITSNENDVMGLTELLNRQEASEIHIYEIIEDWLGQ